uniref:Uncharacterized protein n=1 Tax=Rhizophora mucronata TaxID=61149 RepID=A0A2P2Q232_RHIMU
MFIFSYPFLHFIFWSCSLQCSAVAVKFDIAAFFHIYRI